MALTTYAELQSAIADWLNRTDLAARIPDFIALTESSLNRDLRTQDMVASATLATVAGNGSVTLPDDVVELRTVVLDANPKAVLSFLPRQALEARYALCGSGRPVGYSVLGRTLKLGPTPDAAYAISVTYYTSISALSDTVTSNWVLQAHPDLYLYGALVQASPYLGDDARAGVWAGLYARALDAVESTDNRAQWAGSPIAMQVTAATP
ncbi:MAG: hypothetical protein RIC29_17385 [Rhodospirillaceae bacterium]